MRGIDTQVRQIRRRVFKEIANLAYTSENLKDDVEALPYKIVGAEAPAYRDSIYRERAVVTERIRGTFPPAGECAGPSDPGAGRE